MKKYKKASALLFSAATVLLAAMSIVACIGICRSGGFSRETVLARFISLRWGFLLWLLSGVTAAALPGKAPEFSAGKQCPMAEPRALPDLGKYRHILYAAAFVCLLIGICSGAMEDVLAKAIKICTECVGLG